MHRGNTTEHVIRTFKEHFKSVFVTTYEYLPMNLCCIILPQVCTTLNIMINSRMNPNMSEEAQLKRGFGYNHAPLSPPGTNAVIHDNPGSRGSCDLQVTKGGYIGDAPDHS